MSSTFVLMTAAALAIGATATSNRSSLENPVLQGCLITAKEGLDIQVPAQDAGLLAAVLVRDGTRVKKGDVLAQIDDTEPTVRRNIAEFQKKKAEKERDDTIRLEYAQKTKDVALSEYRKNAEVNKRSPGAVSQIDIERLKLKVEEALLQIKKTEQFDMELAKIEVKIKQAEVNATNKAIDRRKIKARFDGIVAEIYPQAGEWVQAGQPILRLINTNEMLVKGTVKSSQYDPQDMEGRKVTVQVTLARGRTKMFTGSVIYVGSTETATGFDVWANIPNQLEKGRPILRDGMAGDMTIYVK